jgi:hypothetical protein
VHAIHGALPLSGLAVLKSNRSEIILTTLLLARTWTEQASGRKIEVEYVSADATQVTVSARAGTTFTIDLARLSAADRTFVQEKLQATSATPGKGTAAPQTEDSFADIQINNYAIICNRRGTSPKGEWNDELRAAVDAALEKVASEVK